MEGYGRREEAYLRPAIKKTLTFSPYVPKNTNTIATSTSSYSDDEYSRSSSQAYAYPAKDENEEYRYRPPKTQDFLANVQNEASRGRPPSSRLTPSATADWRPSPQTQTQSYSSSPYYTNSSTTTTGYGDYYGGNTQEYSRPVSSRNDNYYSTSDYYGNGNTKPVGVGLRNDSYAYDSYNSGYGTTYDRYQGSGPKMSSSSEWSPAPRSGTQLSEPTHDVMKALGTLKDAGKVYNEYNSISSSNKGRPKPNIWADPPGSKNEPIRIGKALELAKEAERLSGGKNKNGKIGTALELMQKVVTEPTNNYASHSQSYVDTNYTTDPTRRRDEYYDRRRF